MVSGCGVRLSLTGVIMVDSHKIENESACLAFVLSRIKNRCPSTQVFVRKEFAGLKRIVPPLCSCETTSTSAEEQSAPLSAVDISNVTYMVLLLLNHTS